MNKPTTATPATTTPTTLFTIRLWHEDLDQSPPEWRGKITNLHNQEVRYFRDSETLYGVMIKMILGDNRHFTPLGQATSRAQLASASEVTATPV